MGIPDPHPDCPFLSTCPIVVSRHLADKEDLLTRVTICENIPPAEF
jgi:hypothetical protein